MNRRITVVSFKDELSVIRYILPTPSGKQETAADAEVELAQDVDSQIKILRLPSRELVLKAAA